MVTHIPVAVLAGALVGARRACLGQRSYGFWHAQWFSCAASFMRKQQVPKARRTCRGYHYRPVANEGKASKGREQGL
jgi:hypothetical protein